MSGGEKVYITSVASFRGKCIENITKGSEGECRLRKWNKSEEQQWTIERNEGDPDMLAFKSVIDDQYLSALEPKKVDSGKIGVAKEVQWWTLDQAAAPGWFHVKSNTSFNGRQSGYLNDYFGKDNDDNTIMTYHYESNRPNNNTFFFTAVLAADEGPMSIGAGAGQQKVEDGGADGAASEDASAERLEDVERREAALATREAELAQRESDSAAGERTSNERLKAAEEREAALAKREAELEQRERDLASMPATQQEQTQELPKAEDDTFATREAELAQRERELASLSATLQKETQKAIKERETALATREAELARRERDLASLSSTLPKDTNSPKTNGLSEPKPHRGSSQTGVKTEQPADSMNGSKEVRLVNLRCENEKLKLNLQIKELESQLRKQACWHEIHPPPRKLDQTVVGYVYR